MKRYEPIRKYIHLTDNRNSDLSVTNLVGLTIEKRYIPSVANVIGTDLSKYKVIKQGQFACSLMQVSRDGKMPVAMYNGEPSIMSPAYPIFEVNDENELMPEYLHMYLSRPEFDREAVFRAVGGVRGSLDWEDFLDMKMPVPDIEEQRKIVAEYKAVEQRIENNNRLIKALEDTAQAIYHHTFGNHINPDVVKKDWQVVKLASCCIFNTDNITSKDKYTEIRYLDTSSVNCNVFDNYQLLKVGIDEIPSRAKRKVKFNDIIYSTVRPNLKHYGIIKGDINNVIVSTGFAVIRSNNPKISNELIYMILTARKSVDYFNGIAEMSTTTYPSINIEDIEDLKIAIPNVLDAKIEKLNKDLIDIFKTIYIINQENTKLLLLINILLSKLS